MVEKCAVCTVGKLRTKQVREEMFGVTIGTFEAGVCDRCREAFFTSESVDQIEIRSRELGLWGLASKVKLARSGNSLVVRIPSPLARYLKLRSGQEVMLAPDQRHRLVLDLA